ncbi:hypothetical protein J8L13_20865 [Bacteroides fragilis]|uniref:hypothetical protein n=1 Tax=Bacteroides fragilis TaxID=817 RepID=UPI00202F02F2|nr:hypothetical protein [Bacteroides fragilis]MCM0239828.1 hypothetical protein [Bacteroides fragilis]
MYRNVINEVLKSWGTTTFLSFAILSCISIFYYIPKFEFSAFEQIVIIISYTIILFIISGYLIRYIAKPIIFRQAEDSFTHCKECTQKSEQYQFANFDFISFEDLLLIEEKLSNDPHPNKCNVIIYTSDISSEDVVADVVRKNRLKKIVYKVFYLKGVPSSDHIKIYGKENLKKCNGSELDIAADFDIIIYIDSKKNKSGFFCVNYSVADTVRPCTQGYNCNNKCHYENENLFYKKIHYSMIEYILMILKIDNK